MDGRRWAGALLAGVVALPAAACTDQTAGALGSPVPTELRIGVPTDQPGLGLRADGDYTGLDVDLAREVARRLGLGPSAITWVPTTDLAKDTLISTGQADLVVGANASTAGSGRVALAGPYLVVGQDLLVRRHEKAVTGPTSLTGKVVCVITASGADATLRDGYPGVQLRAVGDYTTCVTALVDGTVDAVAGPDVVLTGLARQRGVATAVRVLAKPFGTESYRIAMDPDDQSLCERVSTALTAIVKDGTWKRLVAGDLTAMGYSAPAGNPPKVRPCGAGS
jgi:glutamate transport system substrate-binding protein